MQTTHYTGKHYRTWPLEDMLECKLHASDAEKDCNMLVFGYFYSPRFSPKYPRCLVGLLL